MEVFTRSLYQRQVGRLITPSTHKGVNLVMTYIHEGYGHLRMGRRILHSLCDFLHLPSAQARHIGDNKGIRRERAIDIDVDPADSTDVDVITSAATALSLDDTVENRTEDLAEAIGRITLGPDPAPTPRGGGTRPCRAPLAAPGRGTPWVGAGDSHAGSPPQPPPGGNPCSQKRASSPVSRTPLAGAADQFRERSSAGGVRFLP